MFGALPPKIVLNKSDFSFSVLSGKLSFRLST
nr:MAG TPA: hypothetical protein [Bacteriophage sp.]